MKETELYYPTVETWFICWEDTRENIKAFGSVMPNQCMDTFWNEVDYYTNESDWLAILIENGINPNE
tara:strand:- start:74 stop:274 length:201 start_codon:yes stop_codon:yes gene_type:complete